ncbi:hypothetical protein ACFCYI_23845 [Streptomyces sp. NPDC056257]|uniref:hypothetical protein n=1 Tax=Streptomyces sp. NPDC056257 TaxID=3345765 RepID=UPI0035D85719
MCPSGRPRWNSPSPSWPRSSAKSATNRIKGLLLASVTFIEGDRDTFGDDVQLLSRALDGSGLLDDQDAHFEALAIENAEITTF